MERPTLYDQELINFFAQADLGPMVSGKFTGKAYERRVTRGGKVREARVKRVPDTQTLRPTDQPLQSFLLFTQPIVFGERNPLYGVASSGILMTLFILHSYYAGVRHPSNPLLITISPQMMRFLRGTMERIILRNVNELRQAGVSASEADAVGSLLISAIDSPMLLDQTTIQRLRQYRVNLFIPSIFTNIQFQRLILAARIRTLSPEELEGLIPEITRVYQPLFPGARRITPQMVFEYQKDIVDLAREYKNRLAKGAEEVIGPSQTDPVTLRVQQATQILQNPTLTIQQIDALLSELYSRSQ